MEHAAVDADHQIEVIAQTGVWPGDARIADHVEPIRVRIGNYGKRPLVIRYEHFSLVSPQGGKYAVLPTPPARGRAGSSARHMIQSRFTSVGFSVGRYSGAVYSSVPVHDGSIPQFTAPARQRAAYRKLGNLPSREMIEWAIPEGVLAVAGHIDGYMFFQRVDDAEKRVELHAVFPAPGPAGPRTPITLTTVSAKTELPSKPWVGERGARVSIPFVVE